VLCAAAGGPVFSQQAGTSGRLVLELNNAPPAVAAHLTDDDPPPAPPSDISTGMSGRRAPGGDALAAPAVPAIPLTAPTATNDVVLEPTVVDDGIAPIPLPSDIGNEAQGMPDKSAIESEDIEDVNISAPIPAEVPETELVQERFPNGSLKIAREITQDGQGNFVNHGSWKEWDLQGDLIAEGEYRHGVRQGQWRRVLNAKDSPLFSTAPYNQYQGPFVSLVTLKNGRLEGAWIITDAQGHKISEISFAGGVRHGTATWWHANGKKMQQITFQYGVAHQEILSWRNDGSLAAKEEYLEGRKIESKTEYHAQDRRKSLGDYLAPKMVVEKDDDWWNVRLATFRAEGESDRHGAWTAWHPNGQVQVEGHFQYGEPEGEFTWYYPNGQKSVEGSYRQGERHGAWTWWHDNGLKSSLGDFIDGKPAGKWTWWNVEGKVAQKADFADGVPQQALDEARKTIQATLPAPYRGK
jgi:antitoxin component YwqK of YwqJK toxin-antitoxin module